MGAALGFRQLRQVQPSTARNVGLVLYALLVLRDLLQHELRLAPKLILLISCTRQVLQTQIARIALVRRFYARQPIVVELAQGML